ncbi:hypothetical protein TWF481_005256 [Arthrobotrys musiformis]|uniref:Uncharacterized protein n=1 Tax=Arthrobotrys musiformis TaxID=47236 RepID=A0AAV9WEE7_9PEZI
MNFIYPESSTPPHDASTANLIMGLIGVSRPLFTGLLDTREALERSGSRTELQSPITACPRLDISCNPKKRRPEPDSAVELSSQKRIRSSSQPPRLNYLGSDDPFFHNSDDDEGVETIKEDKKAVFYSLNKFEPPVGHRMELVYTADEEDLLERQHTSRISESPPPQDLPDEAIFHDMSSALYDTLSLIMRNADTLRQGGESIIKNATTMKAHAMNMKAQLEIELNCEMRAAHQDQTPCSCGANTPGSVLNVWKAQFQGGFLPGGMDFTGPPQKFREVEQSPSFSAGRNDRMVLREGL